MYTYSVLLILAFLLAVVLTPFVRRLALRLGAVDHPNERKIHSNPTPSLGGVAVFVAVFLPQLGILFLSNRVAEIYIAASSKILALVGASAIVFALGVWDDLRGLRAPVKLTVQIIAAVILFMAGFRIDYLCNPFGERILLGVLAGPVTVLWLVGITVVGRQGCALGNRECPLHPERLPRRRCGRRL